MTSELHLPEGMPESFRRTGQDGLSEKEAQRRLAAGQGNRLPRDDGKPTGRIIAENMFTLFNGLNLLLGALLAMVGSYRNMLFLMVVIWNTGIAIFQEIKARNTIRRLKLLHAPKARVIREGKETEISPEEAVKGDLLVLRAGDQIVADGIAVSGSGRAMESLLTGESDPVPKEESDWLYSGSYLTEGKIICQLVYTGEESYIGRLTKEAKREKRAESGLMREMKRLIRWDSILLLPLGLLLFLKQYVLQHALLETAVPSAVAAMLGMIPEGLILLTSAAMAIGVIRLARRQVLVQELYGIESLARVDVLCLDKTGTLTSGRMQAEEMIPLEAREDEAKAAIRRFLGAMDDSGATLEALRAAYAEEAERPIAVLPFSSQRKKSAVSLSDGKTLILGAPEFVMDDGYSEKVQAAAEAQTRQGRRVLILAEGEGIIQGDQPPAPKRALALFALTDEIRPSARETAAYFREQGVELKVISGDDPVTVSRIAEQAGILHSENMVDARELRTEAQIREACGKYTVFGRVTPEQKKQIILALRAEGRAVGMTGDGVNDIPALRAADCSIAMAQGADAARNAAQMTLLNSDFAAVPEIVLEGRRVINNITRSATLFLTKTIFSFLLCLLTMVLPGIYPFQPIQMTLVSGCTIGLPGFLLALEPSRDRVQGKFLRNVLRKALPGGTAVAVCSAAAMALTKAGWESAACSTMATWIAGMIGIVTLVRASWPLDLMRGAIALGGAAAFTLSALMWKKMFFLTELLGTQWLVLAGLSALAGLIYWGVWKLLCVLEAKEKNRAAQPNAT